MPLPDDLKLKLRLAAIQSRKPLTEGQLDEAVQELTKKAHVERRDLQELGQKVASDQEIFATTDVDDINNILRRGRN